MPHYTGLNALATQFAGQAFSILGYPCNQFGGQEPGDNDELLNGLKYVRPGGGYVPMFPLTQKISVNGFGQDAAWTFLKAACSGVSEDISDFGVPWLPIKASDVQWNFEAFLMNKQGVPVKRYGSGVNPSATVADITALLAA